MPPAHDDTAQTAHRASAYLLAAGSLAAGYSVLAARLREDGAPCVWRIDGMTGVDFGALETGLQNVLGGVPVRFFRADVARLPDEAIRTRLDGDPEFGRLYHGVLVDFFDTAALTRLAQAAQQAVADGRLAVILGVGSALVAIAGPLAWVDLPKDQIRAAGPGVLMGGIAYPLETALNSVDLPLLRAHKARLLPDVNVYIDLSDRSQPVFVDGDALRMSLHALAERPFRTRRVAYPSAWGGQYLKDALRLDPPPANVGWCYEFVATESGVIFTDGSLSLEVPFDLLLAHEPARILGESVAARFGHEFPVRMNLTDTVSGGDLSCQVHPAPEIAAPLLGYPLVQDETYVVVTAEPGALIHLGLRADADVAAFRRDAGRARDDGVPFDAGEYIDAWPAEPGTVFCIPRGTIHHIGRGAVVLEIISSSVVCTFRLYDYLRPGPNGKPRSVHVERGFAALDTRRRTAETHADLMPEPRPVRSGPGWTEYAHALPTPVHYRVHRAEFSGEYPDDTRGESFHLLHVLDGSRLALEWPGGSHPLNTLDTILVPAAVGAYRLRCPLPERRRVLKVFVGLGDTARTAMGGS